MSQVTSSEPTTEPELVGSSDVPAAIVGRTPWQLFWTRFRRDKVAMTGAIFILLLILAALLAPVFAAHIAHHGPNELNSKLTDEFSIPIVGPSKAYWGGVDTLGRDIFVRTLYGARTSLQVAILATVISVVVGVALGLSAGFYGGKVDTLISRSVDIVLSLPVLLLAIGISAACATDVNGCLGGLIQPGKGLVTLIIALFGWPYMTRIVRGQTLSFREREFIDAARATGYGNAHIMFREILPNLVAPIIVYTDAADPHQHHLRGVPVVPWGGHPARPRRRGAGSILRRRRMGNVQHLRLVDVVLPGDVPRAHHAGLQSPRRWIARRPRSTIGALT